MNTKANLRAVLATSLALASLPTATYAFDKTGHETIEAEAYRKLEATAEGRQILEGLVTWGYLQRNGTQYAVKSASADYSTERQFMQDRQMYHFMASMQDVDTAATQPTVAARQQALLAQALPRCLALMYVLYDELIFRSVGGGSQSGRGIYVLMHIIADSYSREHAPRVPGTGHIITVKSWELFRASRKWPAGAIDPVPAPAPGQHGTLALLHEGSSDNADKEWQKAGGGLAPDGEAARDALVDLLTTVYQAKTAPARAENLWQAFVDKNFHPQGAALAGNTFTFPGDPKPMQISYRPAVVAKTISIFDFERYQRWSLVLVGQTGFARNNAYGVELGFMSTPRRADGSGILRSGWAQTSRGILASVTKIPADRLSEGARTYAHAIQVQAQGAVQASLPWQEIHLQVRAGAGIVPATPRKSGVVAGLDLTRTFGQDMLLTSYRVSTTKRVALGYEFDSSGLPAKHTLCVRFGLQTWQNRISDAL